MNASHKMTLSLIHNNDFSKISAIKTLRELCRDFSLKAAKDFIEEVIYHGSRTITITPDVKDFGRIKFLFGEAGFGFDIENVHDENVRDLRGQIRVAVDSALDAQRFNTARDLITILSELT